MKKKKTKHKDRKRKTIRNSNQIQLNIPCLGGLLIPAGLTRLSVSTSMLTTTSVSTDNALILLKIVVKFRQKLSEGFLIILTEFDCSFNRSCYMSFIIFNCFILDFQLFDPYHQMMSMISDIRVWSTKFPTSV